MTLRETLEAHSPAYFPSLVDMAADMAADMADITVAIGSGEIYQLSTIVRV